MTHMYETDYGRALDAENFLLEPVVEYLRGYKKITSSQEALMNAEEVLHNEIKVILAARDRVLDAFRWTVDYDSDVDTERQLSYEKEKKTPSSSSGDGGHTWRSPSRQPAVRPEDRMSQCYVRAGVHGRLNEDKPSSAVGRMGGPAHSGRRLPIGPTRQPTRLASRTGSISTSSHNNLVVKYDARVQVTTRDDLPYREYERDDAVNALFSRIERWRVGQPQYLAASSESGSK